MQFDIVKNLMKKDGFLDEWIYEKEAEGKRDLTEEEINAFIQGMVDECIEVAQDLSCSIAEAYNDIMY